MSFWNSKNGFEIRRLALVLSLASVGCAQSDKRKVTEKLEVSVTADSAPKAHTGLKACVSLVITR